MIATNTERGAASIRVELRDGGVTMFHGEDGSVLHHFPEVAEGTWDKMFDAVFGSLRDGEIKIMEERGELA